VPGALRGTMLAWSGGSTSE